MKKRDPDLPKQNTVKPQLDKVSQLRESQCGKNRVLSVYVTFCKLHTEVNVLLVFKAFSFPAGGSSIAFVCLTFQKSTFQVSATGIGMGRVNE